MALGPGSQSPRLRNAFSAAEPRFPRAVLHALRQPLSPRRRWGDSSIKHHRPLVRSPPGGFRCKCMDMDCVLLPRCQQNSNPMGLSGTRISSTFLATHLSQVFRVRVQEETSWIQSHCSPLHLKGSHPVGWQQSSLSQEDQRWAGLTMPPSDTTPLPDFQSQTNQDRKGLFGSQSPRGTVSPSKCPPTPAQSTSPVPPRGPSPASRSGGGAKSHRTCLRRVNMQTPLNGHVKHSGAVAGGPQPPKGLGAPGECPRDQEALPMCLVCASRLEETLSCLGFPQA